MEFSFCDTFYTISIFYHLAVVPGPKDQFYAKSKNWFLLFIEDIIKLFCQKILLIKNSTGEKHTVHFMGLPVVLILASPIQS